MTSLSKEEIERIEKEAERRYPLDESPVFTEMMAKIVKDANNATLAKREAFKEGARAECLRAKERGQWILVKERLPEQHGVSIRYLAYIGYGRMRIAWFNGRNFVSDGEELGVTHWQGLPDPPKE